MYIASPGSEQIAINLYLANSSGLGLVIGGFCFWECEWERLAAGFQLARARIYFSVLTCVAVGCAQCPALAS